MSSYLLRKGPASNLTTKQRDTIVHAIWKVLEDYGHAEWTVGGVPDYDDTLKELGRMVGVSVPNMARSLRRRRR